MDGIVKPTFLIIGAMKCGTTTLHHTLEQHPDIFFPEGEVKLFTIDDFEQQHYFFPYQNGKWTDHDFTDNPDKYFKWHSSQYQSLKDETIIGEDVPSYLPSLKAVKRIAQFYPDVKLVVTLRDPVARLYSHYWHGVNNFSMYHSLEESIRYSPGLLISRSCYKRQIEEYLRYFPRDQMHFVIFEQFIKEREAVLEGLRHFIGFEQFAFEEVHANKSQYPRNLGLRLLRNRMLKELNARHYYDYLPDMPEKQEVTPLQKIILKLDHKFNTLTNGKPGKMSKETQYFLQKVLYRENQGLSELIGCDLAQYWPTFERMSKGSNTSGVEKPARS